MQSVIIGKNQAGQRLDKFLHKYLPLAGNGFLYKMLRKKNITLNGKKAEGREILALRDEVCFFFSQETFSRFSGRAPENGEQKIPESMPEVSEKTCGNTGEYERAFHTLKEIAVLYEDEDCLILNKPSGILSQKASLEDLSLNEWLIGYLLEQNPALAGELSTFRPSVCNRLDRNTSGIVLCGKSLRGLQYLSQGIRERSIRKFYRTICAGAVRESGEIKGYLVKDEARNRVSVSGIPGESRSGEKICTIHTAYRPLSVTENFTLLEVELITGKSHQIRAQLADLGHPLIGDRKYGRESVNLFFRKNHGLRAQLLHSCRVMFPENGNPDALSGRSITAPCPALFQRLEKELFS